MLRLILPTRWCVCAASKLVGYLYGEPVCACGGRYRAIALPSGVDPNRDP
jgi:hypothetical protein